MDKIDELLFELKRILSVIDNNYIFKIKSILDGDSDYDKLFYHYVNKIGIDSINAKKMCNDRIKEITNEKSRKNMLKDYYSIKELTDDNAEFTDLYMIIDNNLQYYYDNIDELQTLLINNDSIIEGLCSNYGISLNDEHNYIKMYLSSIFYEYMSSYIDVVDSDDYYLDQDTRYINVYHMLDHAQELKDVINIFDIYINEIIDIFYIYSQMDKHTMNLVHLKIIKSNKVKDLINICPFSIFMFKNYYNLYYNNEEVKSVEIGTLTLRIIEDLIKDAYNSGSFNNIIKNSLDIIKSSYMNYDIDKWLKYLCANVYENIIVKEKKEKEELMILDIVKDEDVFNNMIHQDCLQEIILKKFYEFNHEVYDIQSLKELRSRSINKDKAKIKRINPFYDDI